MEDDFEMIDEDELQKKSDTIGNNYNDSVLAPMYEENTGSSYEEVLKTIPQKEEVKETVVVEEQPKEVVYSDDFMDYDPMLHNDLVTDGNYTISTVDDSYSDYTPNKTNFDSEEMLESYKEENIIKEEPKAEIEKQIPETYNTASMMTYDTNNVDTFNDGEKPAETVVTRFIFDDMNNSNIEKPIEEIKPQNQKETGAINIYNRQEEIDANIKKQNSSRKTYEMVATIIFFALLILIISFFPDINKFFNNFQK